MKAETPQYQKTDPQDLAVNRPIVLVGMMGAGKSAIGKLLAQRLNLAFLDADHEIERAADCTIAEIFERYGEPYFRTGERRVIARLVDGPTCVLATGGGAFMDTETRELLKEKAITIWLTAEFDVLWDRVSRRGHRPLLKTENPQATLQNLMEDRYPIYAEADLTVVSDHAPKEATVDRVILALSDYLDPSQ